MIRPRRSDERGHFDHGWLDAHHTFSFGDYHDPEFMGFGVLRVLNQDRVQPGKGFGTHGHRDMEIVTWVLEGELQHKDSMGNGSIIRPGEAQFMAAGTGVLHSEFNPSATEPLHLLQMWVIPARRGTAPRYEQKAFPAAERRGRLRRVVAPDGKDGAVTIGQDARLFVATLSKGDAVEHRLAPARAAWLHVARGAVTLNGQALADGDGAAIIDEEMVKIAGCGERDAEVVLWEIPAP